MVGVKPPYLSESPARCVFVVALCFVMVNSKNKTYKPEHLNNRERIIESGLVQQPGKYWRYRLNDRKFLRRIVGSSYISSDFYFYKKKSRQ